MKRITRLTERDLTRLVNRIITEQITDIDLPQVDRTTPPQVDSNNRRSSGDLPKCRDMMTNPPSGMVGGGSTLEGDFDKITYNGTVSPRYQGYTVWKNGREFCFIKK